MAEILQKDVGAVLHGFPYFKRYRGTVQSVGGTSADRRLARGVRTRTNEHTKIKPTEVVVING